MREQVLEHPHLQPTFVKLHLQRSPRNEHIALTACTNVGRRFVTFSLDHLIENPSITIPNYPHIQLEIKDCISIVGSCNGLLCLLGLSLPFQPESIWFRIWNPATKTISKPLGSRSGNLNHNPLRYTFGCDNSTTTYKVVVSSYKEVIIFNFGDNNWRTISSFPPLGYSLLNDGVYLSDTVNWFAIRRNLSYQQCDDIFTHDVIISLDLSTETYVLLSPPHFDEVLYVEPTITVLMDCLCFSYNHEKTHFVIWKMAEFRIEQSWTQFVKISLQNLQIVDIFSSWRYYPRLFPLSLCLSENGHKLILASRETSQLIIYNLRDNRVEQTCNNATEWYLAKNYVESLASIC